MSKHLRIGIDVDGILADFNISYKEILERMTPARFPDISDTFPNTWNWELSGGVLKSEYNQVWKAIKDSLDFWSNLPPYENAPEFLEYLSWMPADVDIYFITSRVGDTAKNQTELWLIQHGFTGTNPTVLISSEKGLCAQALNLTHYIDDRDENCLDVQLRSPNTDLFMLKRPWNHILADIPRLDSLEDFASILKEHI